MLLLDVGNSRSKWALVRDGVWVREGTADNADWAALQRTLQDLPRPARILVSNVAGEVMAQQVRSACAGWERLPQFVTARAEQCGVRNTYWQPERLGSDRWAALLAAWREVQGACLVVNCGTATTIDALSGAGEFLGGLILPGTQLMQRALCSNTAQLGTERGTLQDFPRTTADAIYSGMLQATLGAVRHQFGLLQARHGAAVCMLSGGAADELQAHLGLSLVRVENLVLKGLQIIGESQA